MQKQPFIGSFRLSGFTIVRNGVAVYPDQPVDWAEYVKKIKRKPDPHAGKRKLGITPPNRRPKSAPKQRRKPK